jgi:hypothetical protein
MSSNRGRATIARGPRGTANLVGATRADGWDRVDMQSNILAVTGAATQTALVGRA